MEHEPDANESEQTNRYRPYLTEGKYSRDLIVQNLEYIYGPTLVTTAFLFFFAFSDPAQETIIGYLGEIERLFSPADSSSQALDRMVGRVISTTLMLFSLPMATYFACHWVLKTFGEKNRFVWPMLWGIPSVTLLGYAIGFGRAFFSKDQDFDWFVLLVPLAAFLIVFWQLVLVLLKDPESGEHRDEFEFRNDLIRWRRAITKALQPVPIFRIADPNRQIDQLKRYATFIWFAVILVSLLAPSYTDYVGPIGVAAAAAIAVLLILAGCTCASIHMPGRFPLILLVLGLSAGLMNYWMSLTVVVAAIILLRVALRQNKPIAAGMMGLVGIVGLVYFIGGWIIHDRPCRTLSGCNMQTGVPVPNSDRHFSELEDAVKAFRSPGPDETEENREFTLVAAEGGGLYAAYLTAYYLARRADLDAGFANSVFAVSGVSGGSVGAGVYWAIRKSGHCAAEKTTSKTCHTDAVQKILRRDFLSPVLAGFLIRDHVDSVLPYTAIWPTPLDRGHVFERALQAAVQDILSPEGELLGLSMAASPDFDRAAPLLFLNTTRVDTGDRLVSSPLQDYAAGPSGLVPYAPSVPDGFQDLTVLNAMVNSARFPFVTPPSRVSVQLDQGLQTIQLVDGGYFDNSGIETLLDLLEDLPEDTSPKVIVLGSTLVPGDNVVMKGTAGAPAAAFWNAWGSRSGQSLMRLKALNGIEVLEALIHPNEDYGPNFTLNWYLGPCSFDDIERLMDQKIAAHTGTETDPNERARGCKEPESDG
ncbi:MAG: hypothetical protein GJ676_16585 [Rhodobacteraceae bacterium]|nr:hypothetical protein [Paracoccaceae bacterium]